ncbi:MAG: diacylglycerol kinase family protein [Coriobacteriaceae bacterium]|nr:diacylglycerol kinase family protein [Coriobacteriaceae bacterium]
MIPGSEKDHPSFFQSFRYALEGLKTATRTERNINVMLAAALVALVLGFVLKIDIVSWCLVLLCCGIVITAELLNTAIETVVDLCCQEINPLAKRAKDIAAAAVYVMSFVSAIIGIVIFGHALGLW